MLPLLSKVWSAHLGGTAMQAVAPCSSAAVGPAWGLTAVRWASAGKRGSKRGSELKGYDLLLQQWRRSNAPGKQQGSSSHTKHSSKHATDNSWYEASDPFASSSSSSNNSRGRSKGASKTQHQWVDKKHKQRTAAGSFEWQGAWKHSSTRWSDVGMAQAAAAAQLDPDELHNLVFGGDSSSSSSNHRAESSSNRKRRLREARRRAKRMQARAAGGQPAAGTAGPFPAGFSYAEFSYWSDEDESEDDGEHGAQQFYQHRQQQQYWGGQAGTPEWQWWSDEQERQWFEQAWQQQGQQQQQQGQQGWQQQRQQKQQKQKPRQSSSSSSSGHGSSSSYSRSSSSSNSNSNGDSRPWWEQFQQSHQQQHQQHTAGYQQHQHQQQQWSSHYHKQQQAGSSWQRPGAVRHPQSVLVHLAVLGLPADAALQRSQLKAAFHKAAMQWHPDKHVELSAKAAAEAKFKLVKEAYESLVVQASAV